MPNNKSSKMKVKRCLPNDDQLIGWTIAFKSKPPPLDLPLSNNSILTNVEQPNGATAATALVPSESTMAAAHAATTAGPWCFATAEAWFPNMMTTNNSAANAIAAIDVAAATTTTTNDSTIATSSLSNGGGGREQLRRTCHPAYQRHQRLVRAAATTTNNHHARSPVLRRPRSPSAVLLRYHRGRSVTPVHQKALRASSFGAQPNTRHQRAVSAHACRPVDTSDESSSSSGPRETPSPRPSTRLAVDTGVSVPAAPAAGSSSSHSGDQNIMATTASRDEPADCPITSTTLAMVVTPTTTARKADNTRANHHVILAADNRVEIVVYQHYCYEDCESETKQALDSDHALLLDSDNASTSTATTHNSRTTGARLPTPGAMAVAANRDFDPADDPDDALHDLRSILESWSQDGGGSSTPPPSSSSHKDSNDYDDYASNVVVIADLTGSTPPTSPPPAQRPPPPTTIVVPSPPTTTTVAAALDTVIIPKLDRASSRDDYSDTARATVHVVQSDTHHSNSANNGSNNSAFVPIDPPGVKVVTSGQYGMDDAANPSLRIVSNILPSAHCCLVPLSNATMGSTSVGVPLASSTAAAAAVVDLVPLQATSQAQRQSTDLVVVPGKSAVEKTPPLPYLTLPVRSVPGFEWMPSRIPSVVHCPSSPLRSAIVGPAGTKLGLHRLLPNGPNLVIDVCHLSTMATTDAAANAPRPMIPLSTTTRRSPTKRHRRRPDDFVATRRPRSNAMAQRSVTFRRPLCNVIPLHPSMVVTSSPMAQEGSSDGTWFSKNGHYHQPRSIGHQHHHESDVGFVPGDLVDIVCGSHKNQTGHVVKVTQDHLVQVDVIVGWTQPFYLSSEMIRRRSSTSASE
jgi:hypothetical protein